MRPPVRIKWHQDEGFRGDMPDDEWMGIIGPRKWVVISQDRKWHKIEAEAAAIKQHGLRCFYFPCAGDERWVSLSHFVRRHGRMQELARTVAPPFIFHLKRNGQFYRVQLP
jgi:hypothetical protein